MDFLSIIYHNILYITLIFIFCFSTTCAYKARSERSGWWGSWPSTSGA